MESQNRSAASAAGDRLTPQDWEGLRAQFPAVHRQVYLNTGTCGPLPRLAVTAIQQLMEKELAEGRIGSQRFTEVKTILSTARARLGQVIGADARQIALTGRTSDGLNIVLWGMRWRPGDEILTTSYEHPGLLVPLAALQKRYGVEIRYLSFDDYSPSAVLARFRHALSHRTRLIALSHVLWTNGAVMPLTELVRVAHDAGAYVLVDGAQAAGAIPVDVNSSGVDFYALPGQKWLCGPEGTGGLYVSEDALAAVDPVISGYMSARATDHRSPAFMPSPGSLRFEVGVPFVPAVTGLSAVVGWLVDDVGLDNISARIAFLADRFRQQLLQVPGVDVLTPEPSAGSIISGLVAFNIANRRPEEVVSLLAEQGFIARSLPDPFSAVRVSTGFYNTEDELDRLVDCIADLARG